MSRFLKDFSDFETILTPDFRHPPILGKIDELNYIGLLDELDKMNLSDIKKNQVPNYTSDNHHDIDIGKINVDIPNNYGMIKQYFF